MPRTLACLIVTLLLCGCSHVISRPARSAVTPAVTLQAVAESPEAHRDAVLLLGGTIVAMRPGQEQSVLEILSWKIDRWGEPLVVDDDAGRFLAVVERFLDPLVYTPGRQVTLTGRVTGQESGKIGEIDYRYPLLTVNELYLWDTPIRYGLQPRSDPNAPSYAPAWHERANPYDPGYAPYPYTPGWMKSLTR